MFRLLITTIIFIYTIPTIAQTGLLRYNINHNGGSHPYYLYEYKDVLYFNALADTMYGYEGCSYNNTGNPKIISDFYNGRAGGNFFSITGFVDSIFFIGQTANHDNVGVCRYDIINDTSAFLTSDSIVALWDATTAIQSKIYFSGYHPHYPSHHYLFEYDINTMTTDTIFKHPSNNPTVDFSLYGTTAINNYIYFSGNTLGAGMGFFSYNTISKKIDTINTVGASHITQHGSNIYFIGADPLFGSELFEYNGINPPIRLTDFNAGSGNTVTIPHNKQLTIYKNKIYFSGNNNNSNKYDLLAYDIATKQTSIIYSTNSQDGFHPICIKEYNNRLYMIGTEIDSFGLYVYDGIKQPYMVAELGKGMLFMNASPTDPIIYKGDLFFAAHDSNRDWELYRFNDSSVSITTIFYPLTITTYPNPTADDAYLDVQLQQAKTMAIQIVDINGRVVYSKQAKLYSQGKHSIKVPMQQLNAGMYVYRINSGDGQLLHSGKLIKQQ